MADAVGHPAAEAAGHKRHRDARTPAPHREDREHREHPTHNEEHTHTHTQFWIEDPAVRWRVNES